MLKLKSLVNLFLGYTLNFTLLVRPGARERLQQSRHGRSLFKGQRLAYSDDGYWELKPGLDEATLQEYYSQTYWDIRGGKSSVVNERDLHHFEMIRDLFPDVFDKDKPRLMNFGSGHGGVSHLFRAAGWEVVNVEPSIMERNIQNQSWTNVGSLEDLDTQAFDLIYGSHSLEHVASIEKFQKNLDRFVKKGETLAFWEVPNADCPSNGAQQDLIDIPHTYYFQKKFFQKWLEQIILMDSYGPLEGGFLSWKDNQRRDGEVIRVLGIF